MVRLACVVFELIGMRICPQWCMDQVCCGRCAVRSDIMVAPHHRASRGVMSRTRHLYVVRVCEPKTLATQAFLKRNVVICYLLNRVMKF
jgi:hypothetical protein